MGFAARKVMMASAASVAIGSLRVVRPWDPAQRDRFLRDCQDAPRDCDDYHIAYKLGLHHAHRGMHYHPDDPRYKAQSASWRLGYFEGCSEGWMDQLDPF